MNKLSKNSRLRRNSSFQAVYRSGKSYANKNMVLYVLPQRGGQRRVGFAAGKRLGSAVIRNRVKRLLREAYRLHQHRLATGFDLVIVGRQPLTGGSLDTAVSAFLQLSDRAKIFAE